MIFFRKISAAYSPKTTYKQIFAKNLHQNNIHKRKKKILFVIWSPVRHIVRQFLYISIIYDENLVSSNCNKTENLKILQMQTKYFMGKRRAL